MVPAESTNRIEIRLTAIRRARCLVRTVTSAVTGVVNVFTMLSV